MSSPTPSGPTLRVAMVGHAFMGAAHSQAWRTAPRFFDLPLAPEMALVVGRDESRAAEAAARLGWAESATDWRTVLERDDIDVVEINEAFAPVVLAWLTETGADPAKVNPNGGAIALGHPLGATGAKLFATLLNELERTGGHYGLQTMCEGGGTANVTIIERLG